MLARALYVIVFVLLLAAPVCSAQSGPEQIHVSVSGGPADASGQPMDVSQLVFHWSVPQAYLPSQTPRLRYSINGGPEQSAPASVVGVARDTSPPTAAAEHEVLPIYAAKIRAPIGVNITYQVGEGSSFSPPTMIKSLPKPTGNATIVALSHIGYHGYSRLTGQRDGAMPRAEPTIRAALNQSPDAVLLPGQHAYSSSGKPWDGFMRSTQPLQSKVITVAVPGDAEAPEGHHQLRERYVLPHVRDSTPQTPGDEVEMLYHGLTVGPMYVIGLDSTSICTPAQPGQAAVYPCAAGAPDQTQVTWLHDTLEDLREDYKAAWVVVYVHHGPYMFADDGDNVAVRALWTPLFESFGVDLVIHSNEAAYQRTHPLRNQVPLARENRVPAGLGPIYVTPGTAGYANPVGPITDTPPDWIAKIGYDGFTFLRIDATKRLLRVSAIEAENGTVIDSVLIDKDMRAPHLPSTTSTAPQPSKRTTPLPEFATLVLGVVGLLFLLRAKRGAT